MAITNSKYAVAGLGILAVAGLGATAFAAANTTPDSNAGQDNSTVSGFDVSNIQYVDEAMLENTGDPTVDEVTFDIARIGANAAVDVEADNAQVFLELDASTYVECVVIAAGEAECDTSGQAITYGEVEDFNVVAFDTTINTP